MKRIKEKIVSILWRIWGYIHEDIYRCVEHSYLYRRWDYKLRRVFNLACRKNYKDETKMNYKWRHFCENLEDFVRYVEYKWNIHE
jgi:hypothetical protein